MENVVQRPTTPLVLVKQQRMLSSPGLRARSSSNAGGGGGIDPLSKLAGGLVACAPTPTARARMVLNPPASPAPTPLTQRVKGGGGMPPPSPAPTPATKRKGASAVSRVVVFEDPPVVEVAPPPAVVAAVGRGEMGTQSEAMEVVAPAPPPPRAAGVDSGVQREGGEEEAAAATAAAAAAVTAAAAATASAIAAAAAMQGKLEEVTHEKEELRERLERDKSHIKVLMQVLERSRDSVHEAWERGRAGVEAQKGVEEGLRGALAQAEARLSEAGRETEALKERMEREKAQMRVVCAVLTRSRETLRDSMEREKDALAGREVELTGAVAESTLAAASAQREAAQAHASAAHSKALVAGLQSSLADARAEAAGGRAREKALLSKVSHMVEELALTREASRDTVEAAAMRATVAGAAAAAGAAVARKREECLLGEIEGLRKGLTGAIAALRQAALERGWVGGGSGSHSPSSFSSSSSSSSASAGGAGASAGGLPPLSAATEQPHFAGGGLVLCDCGGGVCEVIEAVFGGMANGVEVGVREAAMGVNGGGGGDGGGGGTLATTTTLSIPPPTTQALTTAAATRKSSFAGVFGGKRGGTGAGAPNKAREQAVGSMAAGLTMQLAALHRALADSEARAMAAGHLVARSSQSLEVMRRLLDVYEGFLQRIGEERVIAEARASIAQKGSQGEGGIPPPLSPPHSSTAMAFRGGDSFPPPPASSSTEQQQQQSLTLGKGEEMMVVKVPTNPIPTTTTTFTLPSSAADTPSSLSPRTASHMFFRPMSPLEMERGGHTSPPSNSSSSSNSSSNSPSTIHTYSASSSLLHSVNTSSSSSNSSSVASLFAPLRAALATTVHTLGGGGGANSAAAATTTTTTAELRRALGLAQGNLDELAVRMEQALGRESAAVAALVGAEGRAGAAQSALLAAAHANSRLLAESAELSGYARACEAARGEALRLSSSMAVAVRGAESALSGLVKAHSVLRAGSRRVVGELRGSLEKQLWSSPDAPATGALRGALMGLEECLKASASARTRALKAAEEWCGEESKGGGGGGGDGKFLEAKVASLASLAAAVEGLTRTFPHHASTATSPVPNSTTSTGAMTSPLSPGAFHSAAAAAATAEAGVSPMATTTATPTSSSDAAPKQGARVDTAISPMVFSSSPLGAHPHTPGLVPKPSTSTTIIATTTTSTTMNFTQFMCTNESLLLMGGHPYHPPPTTTATGSGTTATRTTRTPANSPFLAAFPAQSPSTPYLFSSPPQTTPMAPAPSSSSTTTPYYPSSALSNASWPTALSRGSTASRGSSLSLRRRDGRTSRGSDGGGGGGAAGITTSPSLLLLTPMDPALALSPTEVGEEGVGEGEGERSMASLSSTIRGGELDAGLGWTLAAIASIQASADIGNAALMEAVEGFEGEGASIGDGGVESCVDVVVEEGEEEKVKEEEGGKEEEEKKKEEEEEEKDRAHLLTLALDAVTATSTMAKNAATMSDFSSSSSSLSSPSSSSLPFSSPFPSSPQCEPEVEERGQGIVVELEVVESPAPSSPVPTAQLMIGSGKEWGVEAEAGAEEVMVAKVEEVEVAPATPSHISPPLLSSTAATTNASATTTNDSAAIEDFAAAAAAAASAGSSLSTTTTTSSTATATAATNTTTITTSAVARTAGKPPTIPHSRSSLPVPPLNLLAPGTPPPNLDLYVFEGPVLPEGGSHTNSFASSSNTLNDDLESVASYSSSHGSTNSSMSVSESVARGSVRASLHIRGFRGKRRGEKEKERGEGSTRNSSSSDISNISFAGMGGAGAGAGAGAAARRGEAGNGGGDSHVVEDAAPPPCMCRHGAGEPPCTGCGKRIRLPPSTTSSTSTTSSSSLFSKIAGSLMRKSTPQHRHCASCGGVFCTTCTEGTQAPHAILGATPSLAAALDAKGLKVACASCCGSKLLSGDLGNEAAEMLQAVLMGLPLP